MATESQNIFITKKQKVWCRVCDRKIPLGAMFVAENEDVKGTCFKCSPFVNYTLLPPGNVALTRRSKKHSARCAVVLEWNQRRKRHERKGQYVEQKAIEQAEAECNADADKRAVKNEKAAKVREVQDKAYILAFGKAIRAYYPKCPPQREYEIANHACEKHSGRVGRTANAKLFDAQMIERAVVAHIRHIETDYDNQFGKGKIKRQIRAELNPTIKKILLSWK